MWFSEKLFPSVSLSLQGERIYKGKSKYQRLEVYRTEVFGNILLLEDTIQTTQKDEFIYHEMVTHPALMRHPHPKKVLVIGAGDGGVIREVLKYKTVTQVYLVEIDEAVIDISKKYLPSLSRGAFSDKRVTVVIGDGAQFIRQTKERFDVIVIDSPDPIGVARVLFSKRFYSDVYNVLNEKGIMIRQTGSSFLQPSEMAYNYKSIKNIFSRVEVQIAAIPTYIGGFFTFLIGAKGIHTDMLSYASIKRRYIQYRLDTQYYNPDIHFASMQLPNYIRRTIR